MRIAYIAHPIGDNQKRNLKKIVEIVRQINLKEQEVVPFAPYFVDCHALTDSDPQERARGIKNNTFLIKKHFIDEIRLYGDFISHGMRDEIILAINRGIPVYPMTEQTKKQLDEMYPF